MSFTDLVLLLLCCCHFQVGCQVGLLHFSSLRSIYQILSRRALFLPKFFFVCQLLIIIFNPHTFCMASTAVVPIITLLGSIIVSWKLDTFQVLRIEYFVIVARCSNQFPSVMYESTPLIRSLLISLVLISVSFSMSSSVLVV